MGQTVGIAKKKFNTKYRGAHRVLTTQGNDEEYILNLVLTSTAGSIARYTVSVDLVSGLVRCILNGAEDGAPTGRLGRGVPHHSGAF